MLDNQFFVIDKTIDDMQSTRKISFKNNINKVCEVYLYFIYIVLRKSRCEYSVFYNDNIKESKKNYFF